LQPGDLRSMVLDRRRFLRTAIGLFALWVIPAEGLLRRAARSRTVLALRGRMYPGRVVERNPRETARPAAWAG
jgi:hypothetical protein